LPDLRRSQPGVLDSMEAIVLQGSRLGAGMPRFDEWLGAKDVQDLRAYLLTRRNALAKQEAAAK